MEVANIEQLAPQAPQNTGLHRNVADKYYTKQAVVDSCMDLVRAHINVTPDDIIIEPSAGGGAFIERIKELGARSRFYDLLPEHNEIIAADYLTLDTAEFGAARMHIIGNPPFGRQSSTAIKFIKKSCEYASTISFILPKSFKKESMRRHFSSRFHLINEIDLPNDSFSVGGIDYDVPCVFQIWEKRDFPRQPKAKLNPHGYKFVGRDEAPDISVRRVGVNAGAVSKETADKSLQSHYFIKFDILITDEIEWEASNVIWEANNTVGPKSISKQELIEKFNAFMIRILGL